MTQVLLGEKYDWFPAVGSEELLLVPKLYTQEKCDHEFFKSFCSLFCFFFFIPRNNELSRCIFRWVAWTEIC